MNRIMYTGPMFAVAALALAAVLLASGLGAAENCSAYGPLDQTDDGIMNADIKEGDIVDGKMVFIESETDPVLISSEQVALIKDAVGEGTIDGAFLIIGSGTVMLDRDDINALDLKDFDLKVIPYDSKHWMASDKHYRDPYYYDFLLPNYQKKYSQDMTIRIPYGLADGCDQSDVRVLCMGESGNVEEIECTYSDGFVTFEANEGNSYAVATENKDSGISQDAVTVTVAVLAAALCALVALTLIRRR